MVRDPMLGSNVEMYSISVRRAFAPSLPRLDEAANGALRYERHRPDQTVLVRLVQRHTATHG